MHRGTLIVTAGLAFVPAGVAVAATTSHAVNFEPRNASVFCGIAPRVPGTSYDVGVMAQLNGDWPGLQCSTTGIAPKHHGDGDPFVQLGQGAKGRAKLVFLGDNDLQSDAPPLKLKPGAKWSKDGISCTIATSSVTCHNSSGHGFTLKPGKLTTH